MRYPVNAPKPMFPRLSSLLEKCKGVRKAPFSTVAVSTLLILISLSMASIVSYQKSCKREMNCIKAYNTALLRRNEDPLQVQAPFRSPFRKKD